MTSIAPRLKKSVAVLSVVVFAVFVFHAVWPSDMVLFSTDNNIGHNAMMKTWLPYAFAGCWDGNVLAGLNEYMPLSLTWLGLWGMPAGFFTDWFHCLMLAGASLFLLGYFFRKGVLPTAALLGILTAFWLSSNFTLVYAGHTSKFAILFFAAMFLWIMSRLDQARAAAGMLFAGGALGMMLTEQADVGLFFALLMVPYAMFTLWFKLKTRRWRFIGLLALLFLPAFLIALRPALEGYRANVQDTAAVKEDPQAKWEFVTQWSWPPEESIDFIAPGYMGWRSGEPAGPYWGRMGRSAGWEITRQGFQNFKLENMYFGAIPAILALWAICAAWRKKRQTADESASASSAQYEIMFWSMATLLALLLSFGKNFPLYRLFYQLPLIGNIRNPNKFLQIFQIAIAILTAYGLDGILNFFGLRKTLRQ